MAVCSTESYQNRVGDYGGGGGGGTVRGGGEGEGRDVM